MTEQHIDDAFTSAIDAGKVNGAILCATDTKGDFGYTKTYGSRTLLSGENKPHQLDDVLFLASATKLITTIAALTCVEDGILTLDGDISSIAPELAAKKVLTGFSDEGAPQYKSQERAITLRMLLTHSSGLAYHFLTPNLLRWREKNPDADPNTKKSVEASFPDPLIFQPGEGWMYGGGLDWAGRIIERVTGKSLLECMKDRIFTPLGITDAQFFPVTREDLRNRMVDLNPDDPEGTGKVVVGGDGSINTRFSGNFGGHGLFMTAEGYLSILHSILANNEKILRHGTVDMMFQNQLSPEAHVGLHAALEGPAGMFLRVGTAPGSRAGHGLSGLLTEEAVEGWYGERTLSWGGGLTFTWFIDRSNDLCGLVAVLAKLPLDGNTVAELKQTFRHDMYRVREGRQS